MLIPATAIAVGVALVTFLLPNRFESEATILMEPQQVPERYVAANTTIDIREVLLTMTDAILSRTQLLQVIDAFGLYAEERKHLTPEKLIELMRENIKIQPLQRTPQDTKDLNAFTISFTGNDAHSAQEVTKRLTTLFINENNESRQQQSTRTTNFLADQLEVAAADLKQQESRLRDFKMSFLGELPEQQQGNLAILSGLQSQLQNTMAGLSRAREQETYIQSFLSQYEEAAAAAGVAVPGSGMTMSNRPDPTEPIRAELGRLQNEKADLLARGYTQKYPDVVKIDEQIRETKALLAAAMPPPEAAKEGTGEKASASAKPVERDSTIAQLKSQLEANRLEIKNSLAAQKEIESRIAEYQRRLNLTPVREQQLADVMRGYNQSKQHYDDLLARKAESELATSLEKRQQGERFRVIDPPSLPEKPSRPARVKISLIGLVAGIAIGFGLAFFVEIKDHSLRDEEELRKTFAFPLMLGVPQLLTKAEVKRQSRVMVLEWVGGAIFCLLIGATELFVYWRG